MFSDFGTLKKVFQDNGFDLTNNQFDQFNIYADNLIEWNNKINLTSITEPMDIVVKHFIDSILPLKFVDIKEKASIIDVGTGAGFPGIPLSIMRDDINLTLLDSLNKRIIFLKDTAQKIGMDIECIHLRAEEGARKFELREQFDIAVARAVAALPVLCEYCLPYVKINGLFLALKGPNENMNEAATAITLLGGVIENICDYRLQNGDIRKLIVIRKTALTPSKYPRNSGQITKKCL